MSLRLGCALFTLLHVFIVINAAREVSAAPQTIRDRLTVFISDLHLGIGMVDDTRNWSKTEDFRWESEFKSFLDFLAEEGHGKTDLIIVGDFLELWQSAKIECSEEGDQRQCKIRDCVYPDLNLGCNEYDARRRTDWILSQHKAVFEALSTFASAGENRVVIIPGNHDAALIFPSIAQAILDAIPAPGKRVQITRQEDWLPCNNSMLATQRVQIATEGYWLSCDGRILAEHGHQLDEANKFEEWPNPFLTERNQTNQTTYLRRPWGEQFVQEYYNQYEERFPIIDNISEEGLGIRLAVAALYRSSPAAATSSEEGLGVLLATVAGGTADLATMIGQFFKFFLFQVSWDQFRASLREQGQPPQWDIKGIKYNQGVAFLVESIPDSDPMRRIAKETFSRGELRIAPANMTDDEIDTLCNQRAALARQLNAPGKKPVIQECPRVGATLGAAGQRIQEYLLRNRDKKFGDYFDKTFKAYLQKPLERLRPEKPRFDVFVYAHTHLAESGFQPIKGTWSPTVVNTGAFQRVVTPQQLKKIQARKNLDDKNALLKLQPEDLPACYSYIRINPYQDKPLPLLRYWAQDDDSKRGEQRECN